MIRRLVRTIWHGTWINATQDVLNSIRSSDRFSARYFSAHRPRSGSIRALHAFRLHASAAITIYSGLPWCCTQAGMSEPAEDVLGRHSSKRLAQGIIEPGPCPRLGPTEPLLELREHLLDRGVVRAVRRQRPHVCPRPFDRLRHPGGQVRLEVVKDDHLPRVQF